MSRASTLSVFTTLAAGFLGTSCARAPTVSGSDQVYDPNIELTALKDNGLANLSWNVVDNYMNGVIGAPGNPGCAIGIARGGELVYLHGYGKAKLGGESWGVATMGAVGSVSKSFTAAGVLLMHQRGILDVNQTVGSYLAGGNAAVSNTMVARLLNHTSGVGGATKAAAFAPTWGAGTDARACIDGKAAVCATVAHELVEPRLAFAQYAATEAVAALAPAQAVYSNVGLGVAGSVLDARAIATTGEGYEDWIWNNVGGYPASDLDAGNLLSLALTHSWRATDIPHRAVGYQSTNPGFATSEAFDPDGLGKVEGWEGPAGGWAMTIGDLTRFAVALNTAQIVNGTMLAAMRFPWAQFDGLPDQAGMGVLLSPAGAPYWHGGGIGGHTAAWMWWDNYGGASLGIALMCNRNDVSPYSLQAHATAIAGQLGGSQPNAPIVALPGTFNLPSADGRSWALDRTGAWQVAPRRAVLPITALSHDLVLRASVAHGRLSFSLVEATVAGGRAEPAKGRPAISLGVANVATNPRFSTRPTELRLASVAGDVTIHGAVLAGTFDRQGAQLSTMSISGTLDTREIGALVGRTGPELCRELATTGTPCAPCADGATACLPFGYEGYVGRAVTVP